MITFHPTKPDLDRLKSLAASGSSGVAKKAQSDLRDMVRRQLEQSVRAQK